MATQQLAIDWSSLGAPIERHPIYPTANLFPNDPSALPNKAAYLIQDVARLAREQGLQPKFPTR